MTQTQMQYSQFQQPTFPGHGRSQSQQIFQHQHMSSSVPQVQARPPPSHQVTPPLPNSSLGSSDVSSAGQRSPNHATQNRVISTEEDMERLLHVCKAGRGNASLLHEALIYAKPDDLEEKGIIQVSGILHGGRCAC